MGKVKQVVFEDLEPYESVDANASVALKEKHRIYGQMIRLLAEKLKGVLGDSYRKGMWQSTWTIATKAFSMGVKGWSLETTKNTLRPQAESLANFPMDKFDLVVATAWDLGQRYVGMLKRKQPREIEEIFP